MYACVLPSSGIVADLDAGLRTWRNLRPRINVNMSVRLCLNLSARRRRCKMRGLLRCVGDCSSFPGRLLQWRSAGGNRRGVCFMLVQAVFENSYNIHLYATSVESNTIFAKGLRERLALWEGLTPSAEARLLGTDSAFSTVAAGRPKTLNECQRLLLWSTSDQ